MDNVGGVVTGFILRLSTLCLARAHPSGLYGIRAIHARSVIGSLWLVGDDAI